ncbi:MAG TPA: hypothetical protein VFK05_26800, partial [Polyangiaceae bacterium]|nr:hypothetical protein [Polyangiaceae bacterium]
MMHRGKARHRRQVGRCFYHGLLFAAFWLSAFACSTDTPRLSKLAQGCALNSECDSPLVCAFQRCHVACQEDRDCKQGEERCVRGENGNVCQLDQEIQCTSDRNCPGKQICAADGECRDLCKTANDCTPTQICANSGECASTDPTKDLVDAKGNIHTDPFGSSTEPEAAAGAGGAMNGEEEGAGAGGTKDESPPEVAAAGDTGEAGAGPKPSTDPVDITSADCAPPDSSITHESETLSKAASWHGEHVISGNLYVQAALDIAPCTVVRFNAGAAIRVQLGGALHAIGASGRAIRFTSAKAAKAAGDWGTIQLYSDASNDSRFEQVIVEYGSDGAVGLQNDASGSLSSVLVQHVTGNAVSWGQRVKVSEFENVVVKDA